MKLYEAVDALATVSGWIEEHGDEITAAGGELSPELAELLDQAEGDFRDKAERVGLKIRELMATAEAVKSEEARLAQRRKAWEHAATSLKQYLQRGLEAAQMDSVKGTLCTVAIQKNPPSVKGLLTETELAELALAGSPFVTVVPESYALDRKSILTAFKAGEPIPAGLTVEQGVSVRVR
jgi:hypothetical protein